jgi:hypothetical protein
MRLTSVEEWGFCEFATSVSVGFGPTHKVAEAMDKINDRWGEFVITPALMMGMGDVILDRISFGGVKELEEIYSD